MSALQVGVVEAFDVPRLSVEAQLLLNGIHQPLGIPFGILDFEVFQLLGAVDAGALPREFQQFEFLPALRDRETQQLQRKYVLHKYRVQKVRQRQEATAAQVRQRDMWQSTEQTAAAQHTATVPCQPAQKPPAPTMTAAQQRAKQHTQRAAQRQMLQQTKAAARKAGQRLEQMVMSM